MTMKFCQVYWILRNDTETQCNQETQVMSICNHDNRQSNDCTFGFEFYLSPSA